MQPQPRIKDIHASGFVLWSICSACALIVIFFAWLVVVRHDLRFDESVFMFLQNRVTDQLTQFIQVITFFGSQKFLLPANLLLIFYFLVLKKRRRYAIQITIVSLTNVVFLFLLKGTIRRERPAIPLLDEAAGFSFPSGHMFCSITFYGMLAYICWRNIDNRLWRKAVVIFFGLFPILIGYTRIYLRVHYTSDVIAGFCLGIMWLLLAWWWLIRTKPGGMKISAVRTA